MTGRAPLAADTVALYLHIPFCRQKCPYCDFFSVSRNPQALAAYPDQLLRQLELARRGDFPLDPFASVFFGGGTPSLLPPEAVAAILAHARELYGIAPGAEISLEANPGTLSPDKLEGYLNAGINRLSLGVQSLRPEQLRALGRLHTPEEALKALHWARAAGFSNIGADLMFGLPGERTEELLEDLEAILAQGPEHLSLYGLTVEEGTPFQHRHRRGELLLPEEETTAEMFLAAHQVLQTAGYSHYEISNYALPGRECRHNLHYWRRRGYLGIGAGAHAFHPAGWGERRAVPNDLADYRRCIEAGEDPSRPLETFSREEAMAETLYLGLRTREGVAEEAFRARFGVGVAQAFPAAVAKIGERLTLRQGYWRLDLQGWLIYDYLVGEFFA